ncbi:hypothetical protein ACWA7J_14515 [Leptothrix sp. BB-4]
MPILTSIGVLVLLVAALLFAILRSRNMHIWIKDYVFGSWRRPASARQGPTHVLFCFVDHYEPGWKRPDYDTECRRVQRWVDDYPKLCEGHRDADGRAPQHTFFYPEEEYRPEHIDQIVKLCQQGYGEIEVHLHHDNDTEAGLREKLRRFVDTLAERHRALPVDPATGKPMWSFIHGNWALDNSRPDGRWCGVNNELIVLRDEGCYADFTMPSAPSDTQTSTINRVYYAEDDPCHPKSHDHGVRVRVGGKPSGDLMLIQGPLGLLWGSRKFGLIPRIEAGDITTKNPPTRERVDVWVETGVHVEGRPDWVFVKIHTHGTQERDMDTLLGQPVSDMFSYLESRYNDGQKHVLHYVNAREMYNIAKAAEQGLSGNPNQYRDHVVPRPGFLHDA